MTDNFLDKYVKGRNGKDAASADEDDTIDVPGFGWLRGIRDASIMLEIRHRDGHISAFSYSMLDRAEFDPSDGIMLKFAGAQVRIMGRNLNAETRPHLRLFEGITRRRVSWIQEADEPTMMEAPKGAVVIESVEVKQAEIDRELADSAVAACALFCFFDQKKRLRSPYKRGVVFVRVNKPFNLLIAL